MFISCLSLVRSLPTKQIDLGPPSDRVSARPCNGSQAAVEQLCDDCKSLIFSSPLRVTGGRPSDRPLRSSGPQSGPPEGRLLRSPRRSRGPIIGPPVRRPRLNYDLNIFTTEAAPVPAAPSFEVLTI